MSEFADILNTGTKEFLVRRHRMLINGKWVNAKDEKRLDVINPADETVISSVPAASAADIDHAVTAARGALEQGPWQKLRPAQRQGLLLKRADLMLAS